jgi:glycosyltransferase involved in cell wall biosynthesis
MTVPLISVALPVRNGANYLAAALDSILAQTFTAFELHVSDNASDDETPAILADYAARDVRVKVSRSEELIPQPANVNRAARLGTSRWIKLFCHDDLMRPDCLAQIAGAITEVAGTSIGLIGNGEQHLFGNGYRSPEPADEGLLTLSGKDAIARKLWDVRRAVPFPAVTTATVRRDAFEAVGGFDLDYVHFDTFCWLELLTRFDYAVLSAPLTVNRIHGAQVAVHARASLREFGDWRRFLPRYVKRHGDELGMDRKARLRLRLIPAALAARAVASDICAGRPGRALRTVPRIPLRYWPLLPALVVRAVRSEHKRLGELSRHVPRELLYPG